MNYRFVFTLIAAGALTVAGIFGYLATINDQAEAAEGAVDTTVFTTNTSTMVGSPAAVWISDQVGYVFYLGAEGDIEMASSTNGGTTWSSGRTVDSVNTTDAVNVAIWWDGWTPGTTTTRYIHIATTDTGVDDTYYTRYDTTNNTLSTTVLGTTQGAACTRGADCYTSITRAANGVLYMAAADASDSWVVSCSTTCTTAGNWSERTGGFLQASAADVGDDYPILMPIAGNNNIILVYWDTSADTIDYNIYSATSSSWYWSTSSRTITAGTGKTENTTYDAQLFGAAISTTTGVMMLALVDDANDYVTEDHDINAWVFSSSTSWVAKGGPVSTASGGLTGVKVTYDSLNNRWYVIYGRRTTIGTATTGNIYYMVSDRGGQGWSLESGPINDNADDISGLTTGLSSPARIGSWWNYLTAPRAADEYYDLVVNPNNPPSISISSPADASSNSDTTPTFEFTGTDSLSESVRYNIQIDESSGFNDTSGTVADTYAFANIDANTFMTANRYAYGQSFQPTTAGNLAAAEFQLMKAGTVTGTLIASLYEVSDPGGTYRPFGPALATSSPIDISTLTGSLASYVFRFGNNYTLSTTTTYGIGVECYCTADAAGNNIQVGWDNSTPGHSGNYFFITSINGSYTASTLRDIPFIVYLDDSAPTLSKVSGTDSGFTNTTDGGDTDPFDSGDLASFTVQAGNELVATTTYYWRVRAKDTAGSNTYSLWSTVRSFTVTGGAGGGGTPPIFHSEFFF